MHTGTTLNFKGRLENKNGLEIFVRALDIKFEQEWSVGLGTTLDDVKKIKKYFSSSRDFSR